MKILCRRYLFISFLTILSSAFTPTYSATPLDTNFINSAISNNYIEKMRDYLDAKKNNFDLATLISSFPSDATNPFFIVLFNYIKDKKPSEPIKIIKLLLKKVTPNNYMLFKSFFYLSNDLKTYINISAFLTCRNLNKDNYINNIEYKEIEKLFILDVFCHEDIFNTLSSFIINKNFLLANLVLNDTTHPIEKKSTEKLIQDSILTFNHLTETEQYENETKLFYINFWKIMVKNRIQNTDLYRIAHDLKNKKNDEESLQRDQEKLNRINQIEKQLLTEFSGWDETIKNIMSVIKKVELFPQSATLPLVIPIIGLNGYGKTTLVQRLVELMDWQGIFQYYPMTFPTANPDNIFNKNSSNRSNGCKFKYIVLYDDIQNIVYFDDINLKNTKNRYDLIFDRYDIDFRSNFNNKLYRILNNGMIEISSSHSIYNHISKLSHQIDKLKIYFDNIKSFEFKINSHSDESSAIEIKYKNEIEIIANLKKQLNLVLDDMAKDLFLSSWLIKTYLSTKDLESLKEDACTHFKSIEDCNHAFQHIQDKIKKSIELIAHIKSIKNSNISIKEIKANNKKIKEFKEEIKKNRLEIIKSYYVNDTESLIKDLINDFPDILKTKEFKGHSLFYNFIDNPYTFIKNLNNYSLHINPNKKIMFDNTIIFFSGTPTHLIDKVNNLYKGSSENQIDPDLYVDKFKELIIPAEITQWVVDIIGHYNHELQSLIGVHRFKLNLPLNNQQWIELIQKKLSTHQDEFKKLADQHHLKGTLDFDQSLLLLLYREGVAPLSGPKALSSADAEIMGSFAKILVDALEEKGINDFEKLTVFYQIKNQKHYLVASNNRGLSIDLPIGIHYKFNSKDIQQREAIKERQALHWAGFTVVGTTLFHSLPRQIENKSIESLEEVHSLWKMPSILKWEYTKNMVLTYLGAYACECEFMNNRFRTKMATLFYPIILKLLHELKENLELARQSIQHQKNMSKPSLEEILPPNLWSDPFYRLVDQEEYDKIIDDLLNRAKSIVKENQTLISALANELVQKNSLNNNQLKDIYLYNLRIRREKSWPLWLVETITRFKIKSDYITPPYLETILKHSPEEISPIEALVIPYNYPQPKTDPLKFNDIAEEFVDQLYFGKTF